LPGKRLKAKCNHTWLTPPLSQFACK